MQLKVLWGRIQVEDGVIFAAGMTYWTFSETGQVQGAENVSYLLFSIVKRMSGGSAVSQWYIAELKIAREGVTIYSFIDIIFYRC